MCLGQDRILDLFFLQSPLSHLSAPISQLPEYHINIRKTYLFNICLMFCSKELNLGLC
jgi:hypothetical protein